MRDMKFSANSMNATPSGREERAAGSPSSPDSRMLCTIGICPSNGIPYFSAIFAPFLPYFHRAVVVNVTLSRESMIPPICPVIYVKERSCTTPCLSKAHQVIAHSPGSIVQVLEPLNHFHHSSVPTKLSKVRTILLYCILFNR